ncbi:MAG: bifunctional DNA-formamidopyrimidine glycosylase/DNA-(apurinic or apyrimidinic site) lyase [Elusimicrobiota bacterium]
MPELPEVETICCDLQVLIGQKIEEAKIFDDKLLPDLDKHFFNKEMAGRSVSKIFRRGKYFIVEIKPALTSPQYLIIHLRMTGQLVLDKLLSSARMAIRFSSSEWLNFIDQRRFGTVELVDHWQELPAIKAMGPEPFSEEFDWNFLKKNFANRKTQIKALLIDQKFMAGIGNIYAQEALFLAGIKPQRSAQSLLDEELKKLVKSIKYVLEKAIKYRGSSIDNYVDGYGNPGEAHLHHFVYSRGGKPCHRCEKILQELRISGRGTVFCPHCQK